MKDHALKSATSSRGFSGPHFVCSCGRAAYYTRTRAAAKPEHAKHVRAVKARETLTKALARWEGSPMQLFCDVDNVADWAERDQDECRRLADADEDASEAENNMKLVRELAQAFRALLVLDGWSDGRK